MCLDQLQDDAELFISVAFFQMLPSIEKIATPPSFEVITLLQLDVASFGFRLCVAIVSIPWNPPPNSCHLPAFDPIVALSNPSTFSPVAPSLRFNPHLSL